MRRKWKRHESVYRGASQTVHLSTAVDGFDNMHMEQVQFAPTFLLGGCLPAAAQSNPLTGGAEDFVAAWH